MALKVCVFDFDGTLVDTMGGFADIAADVLEKHCGVPFEKGRSQYLHTSGIPFFQQLEIILPDGKLNEVCAREFESRKLDGFFDCVPGDATVTGLELLRGAGFKLVVSSNNFQDNVDAFLDRHPLPLDLALGFEHTGLEKGRPHFNRVQEHFKVRPEEVLFCGDSLKDGEKASGCGVHFVGMTGTFTREQFLERFPGIQTVDTILELAERLVDKQM